MKKIISLLVCCLMLCGNALAEKRLAPLANLNPTDLPQIIRTEMPEGLRDLGVTEEEYQAYLRYRPLNIGDTGEDVYALKSALLALSYYTTSNFGDKFTKDTMTRIDKWRKDHDADTTIKPGSDVSPEEQLFLVCLVKNTPPKYETLNYRVVARNPELYVNMHYTFNAKVLQQLDSDNSDDVFFLVYINGQIDNLALCYAENFRNWEWDGQYASTGVHNLLKGDQLKIKAEFTGHENHKAVNGETLSVLAFTINNLTLID